MMAHVIRQVSQHAGDRRALPPHAPCQCHLSLAVTLWLCHPGVHSGQWAPLYDLLCPLRPLLSKSPGCFTDGAASGLGSDDCTLIVQLSMSLCPLYSLKTGAGSRGSMGIRVYPFGKTKGVSAFFHQNHITSASHFFF